VKLRVEAPLAPRLPFYEGLRRLTVPLHRPRREVGLVVRRR